MTKYLKDCLVPKGDRRYSVGVPNMKISAFFLMLLLSCVGFGQQKPVTGYAPVNGLKMYYEIHGSGEPVVLLHGVHVDFRRLERLDQ